MAENVPKQYKPQYGESHGEVDAGIRGFVTEFYRVSDNIKENERWVSSFTTDAYVQIGGDKGVGTKEIRELRGRMWAIVQDRSHTVLKVYPGKFGNPNETECMLLGTVKFSTKDGRMLEASWSGHAVLRKVNEDWKLARYQVWVQTE